MLFILTGNVQIGKTTWLMRLVDELASSGRPASGVVAPGVWAERESSRVASAEERAAGAPAVSRFEKLGIDNVLLPQGERIPFAQRADLARVEGSYDAASQAARAQLVWHISDDAIAQVNAHFSQLALETAQPHASPSLLVVDEFGRLELERNEGLTEALSLVAGGPTARFPHALVVVRQDLLPLARTRFEDAWHDAIEAVSPTEDAARRIISLWK